MRLFLGTLTLFCALVGPAGCASSPSANSGSARSGAAQAPDWSPVVAAEVERLEAEYGPEASIRVVVLDLEGRELARADAAAQFDGGQCQQVVGLGINRCEAPSQSIAPVACCLARHPHRCASVPASHRVP